MCKQCSTVFLASDVIFCDADGQDSGNTFQNSVKCCLSIFWVYERPPGICLSLWIKSNDNTWEHKQGLTDATLTGCRSLCRWAPASLSRWSSVDSLSLDRVYAPAESVLATAWTAQTVWTSLPRSDPTTAETLRRENSPSSSVCTLPCRAFGLLIKESYLPSSFSGLLQRISMNESPSLFFCLNRASLFPQQRRHCSLPTQWVGYREHVLMITLIVTYSRYRHLMKVY